MENGPTTPDTQSDITSNDSGGKLSMQENSHTEDKPEATCISESAQGAGTELF